MILYYLFIIVVYVLYAMAFMRLARIAGRPEIGWMAWFPVLSSVQQLLLIRKSGWWVFMFLVPGANFVFAIIWQVKLLNAFGKSGSNVLFAIFLGPVYFIQWLVWGFSSKTRYMVQPDGTIPKVPSNSRAYRANSDDGSLDDNFLDNDSFDSDSFDFSD